MIKTYKAKVPANIGSMSLVGILNENYPLSYDKNLTLDELKQELNKLKNALIEDGVLND